MPGMLTEKKITIDEPIIVCGPKRHCTQMNILYVLHTLQPRADRLFIMAYAQHTIYNAHRHTHSNTYTDADAGEKFPEQTSSPAFRGIAFFLCITFAHAHQHHTIRSQQFTVQNKNV